MHVYNKKKKPFWNQCCNTQQEVNRASKGRWQLAARNTNWGSENTPAEQKKSSAQKQF